MLDQRYVAQNYKIISSKGDHSILLFPDLPYWIATTNQGVEFLEQLDGTKTVAEVTKNVLGIGLEPVAEEFLKPLIDSKAVLEPDETYFFDDRFINAEIKPDKITLLQTMRCNLRCKHCSVPLQPSTAIKDELDVEQTKDALLNISKIMGDHKELTFLGGEPLMRKDMMEIATFAHENGFELGLSTNATMLDEEFAKKAQELNVTVQISLDGPTKNSHEFIRGQGTWDKAMRAIELLKKYDVKIRTNMVFHKGNADLVAEYISLGRRLEIRDLRLIPLLDMGRAKDNLEFSTLETMVDVFINLIKEDPSIVEYIEATNFMGLVMNARITNRMIGCGSGVITLILDPKGDIYPCLNTFTEEFKITNVFEENFEETFWNSPVRQKFRSFRIDQLNDTCKECDFRFICGGLCRGETHSVTSDIQAPYPYCESWKKAMIKIYWLLTEYPELGKEKAEKVIKGIVPFSMTC